MLNQAVAKMPSMIALNVSLGRIALVASSTFGM
jgi:hypothetical protein